MPNPQNLEGKGFQPGQSGNPAGRPPGIPNSKTRYKRLLEVVSKMPHPVTGEEQEFTQLEIMDMKIMQKALKAVENSSNKGDTVLDLFLGSGSTLIACEQTDRTCYGMELDPKYTDVIRKRWAKYVYGDEVLENDKWIELTPVIA